ncbi:MULTISPECIES: hypothetical protein [unclassified Microcoleus]|uniref:hypothetical protein n=2 Tax=Microcoleus TaxID=44471 RepID=UPI002FD57DB3
MPVYENSRRKFPLCGTGILRNKGGLEAHPTPQEDLFFVKQGYCRFMKTVEENSLFVEQASCLFLKKLNHIYPPIKHPLCGTGILPVPKKVKSHLSTYKTPSLWNRHLACS